LCSVQANRDEENFYAIENILLSYFSR